MVAIKFEPLSKAFAVIRFRIALGSDQTVVNGTAIDESGDMRSRVESFPIKLLYLLFAFALNFFHSPLQAASTNACTALFHESSHSTPADTPKPLNKFEKLAGELGLTYIKAPVPAGYRRTIINSRIYTKKDGTQGKTLRYYRFYRPDGSVIRPRIDAAEYQEMMKRFAALEVQPNWTDVWLSTNEKTHIQVLAKNALHETVAIYHNSWSAGASVAKFKRVQSFGPFVTSIRNQLNEVIQDKSLNISSKEKVEATAYLLLMSGRIRVGDIKYLQKNGTSGVTTLQKNQVYIDHEGRLFLRYIGKSGNKNSSKPTITTLEITDALLKASLTELKNSNTRDPRLLVYQNRANSQTLSPLSASSLNGKLKNLVSRLDTAGKTDGVFSVKDFRTWAATVKTVEELIRAGPPPTELPKKDFIFMQVSKNVSRLLNNTPAVARQDYIDPRLLNPDAYVQLWALAKAQFPQLITATAIENNTQPFDVKYNLDFEPLAIAYLKSLELITQDGQIQPSAGL